MKQAITYSLKVWLSTVPLLPFFAIMLKSRGSGVSGWTLSSLGTLTSSLPLYIVFLIAVWLVSKTTQSVSQKKTKLSVVVLVLLIIALIFIMKIFGQHVISWNDGLSIFLISCLTGIGFVWFYNLGHQTTS